MKPKAVQSKKLLAKRKSALTKQSKKQVVAKILQKNVKNAFSGGLHSSPIDNGLTDGRKKNNTKVIEHMTFKKEKSITGEHNLHPSKNALISSALTKNSKAASAKYHKVDQLVVRELPYKCGALFAIGENDVGQLGLGEETEVEKRPVEVNLPISVVDIACGGMHSICLAENGEVYTFGCNDEGALGRSTAAEGSEYAPEKVEISEIIVQISAGDSHSAALSEKGQVYIWGNFRDGQGSMGLTLDAKQQPKPMKILSHVTVVKIASGNEHLVCLSSEGKVYTCGCAEAGQLGRITERCSRDGGRKGLGVLLLPDQVHVRAGKRTILIDDIWTGAYSTFLKARATSAIYAFGLNNFNHLGFQGELARFSPKLVSSFNNKQWVHISGGQHHTLALDSTGCVHVLGRKEYGRLGLGENCDDQKQPAVVPSLEHIKCTDVSSGNIVSYAVTEDGSVYSWGMGTNYQLGHGNDDDVHVPKIIAGNFASWKAFRVCGGGQHALILAQKKTLNENR